MAKFRYLHLFTKKIGDAAKTAAASILNQGEIGLAIHDGDEKILFKNESGNVVSVPTDDQVDAKLRTKVDRQLTSANGKALIFNETDGGGAKFEHTDGTWSFAGVNDGGHDGLAGQIYAVDHNNGNTGTRIDISVGGMYYTKGNEPLANRMVRSNEIATIGDIIHSDSAFTEAIEEERDRAVSAETALLDAIEAEVEARQAADADEASARTEADEALEEAINDEVAERKSDAIASVDYVSTAKTINFFNANGEVIDTIDATDFIKDGMIDSVELETSGDTTYLVITWNTDAGKQVTRLDVGDLFEADNYYTKTETNTLLANKTDYIVNGTNGRSLMFNEADGGGAKFENKDGINSFVGVNDAGAGGITAQIYSVRKSTTGVSEGARIDVSNTGMYYTVGNDSSSARMVAANEIATKGDVEAAEAAAKVTAMNVDGNAGITLTLADGTVITATEAENITLSAGEF